MAIGDRVQRIVLRAVDETRAAFRSVQTRLGRIGAVLTRIGTQLGLIFGLGISGVPAKIARMANEMDNLAKTAAKLGTTTEELSKLQYAGKLTGVEADTLSMALQRMTRRIEEAANGTGEAKDALRELGLDARKLGTLTPDQQFAALADAFARVGSQAERVRLAFKLFDSEGVVLVNTLALGKQGLEDVGAELEKLGAVIDSDTAAAAERFNDALAKLNARFSSLGVMIANKVLPNFAAMVEVLGGKSIARAFVTADMAIESIIPGISELNVKIAEQKQLIDNLALRWKNFLVPEDVRAAALASATETLRRLEEQRVALIKEFADRRADLAERGALTMMSIEERLGAALVKIRGTQMQSEKDYIDALKGVVKEEEALLKRVQQAGKQTAEGIAAVQIGDELDSGDLFIKLRDAMAALQGGDVEGARQTVENIAAAMDTLNKRGELNIVTAQQLRDALAALVKDIAAVREQDIIDAAKAQEQAKSAADAIEQGVHPKLSLELNQDSVEQIKTAVYAAMQGFSVPVTITPRVAGGAMIESLLEGLPAGTRGSGVPGVSPIEYERSAAEGHR